MAVQLFDNAKTRILLKASEAFLAYGYAALTMAKLAECCELTRRGLYHHFSDKEEVFRGVIRIKNVEVMEAGDAAAQEALVRDDGAVDVIFAWLDARFGRTRRNLGRTPHGHELNEVAFRLALDIMIEMSYESNRKLSELVEELCRRGRLRLREGVDAAKAGRLIGDGARGVNQARPPIPNDLIAQHYRDITEAILFGCASL